jgi:hypothetical protein
MNARSPCCTTFVELILAHLIEAHIFSPLLPSAWHTESFQTLSEERKYFPPPLLFSWCVSSLSWVDWSPHGLLGWIGAMWCGTVNDWLIWPVHYKDLGVAVPPFCQHSDPTNIIGDIVTLEQ